MCPIPVIAGIGHEIDKTILDEIARIPVSAPSMAIVAINQALKEATEEACRAIARIAGAAEKLHHQQEKNLWNAIATIKDRLNEHQRQKERELGGVTSSIQGVAKEIVGRTRGELEGLVISSQGAMNRAGNNLVGLETKRGMSWFYALCATAVIVGAITVAKLIHHEFSILGLAISVSVLVAAFAIWKKRSEHRRVAQAAVDAGNQVLAELVATEF
jgi:exonuclease VII large subunit